MAKNVLVLAAHPDDAEIAMGGTIAKMLRQKWRVELCDLTDGEPTPNGSPEKRAREAREAAQILEVQRRITLDLPNRYLMDTVENRQKVAEIIRGCRPDILFLPYWEDAHPDHVQACQLCEAARFYAKLTKTQMQGDPFYPKRVIHYFCGHYRLHRRPTFILDISETLEIKLKAIAAYESQFGSERDQPWIEEKRRSSILETVQTVAAYYGRLVGTRFAEPFIMREELGLTNLEGLMV